MAHAVRLALTHTVLETASPLWIMGVRKNVTEEARLPPPLDIIPFDGDDEYNNP
jgi:hypothetical protein